MDFPCSCQPLTFGSPLVILRLQKAKVVKARRGVLAWVQDSKHKSMV